MAAFEGLSLTPHFQDGIICGDLTAVPLNLVPVYGHVCAFAHTPQYSQKYMVGIKLPYENINGFKLAENWQFGMESPHLYMYIIIYMPVRNFGNTI